MEEILYIPCTIRVYIGNSSVQEKKPQNKPYQSVNLPLPSIQQTNKQKNSKKAHNFNQSTMKKNKDDNLKYLLEGIQEVYKRYTRGKGRGSLQ